VGFSVGGFFGGWLVACAIGAGDQGGQKESVMCITT